MSIRQRTQVEEFFVPTVRDMSAPPQFQTKKTRKSRKGQPPDPVKLENALRRAVLALSTFRNRLSGAGYPFAEPPGVREIINEADRLLHPDN